MNNKMIVAALLAGVFTTTAVMGLVGLRGMLAGTGFRASAREALGVSSLAGAATFGTTIAAANLLNACPRRLKAR